MSESQPWDNEPEIEDDADESVADSDGPQTGGWMASVAAILTLIAVVWAVIGTTPTSVLFLVGVWLMAGTFTCIAEVYSA